MTVRMDQSTRQELALIDANDVIGVGCILSLTEREHRLGLQLCAVVCDDGGITAVPIITLQVLQKAPFVVWWTYMPKWWMTTCRVTVQNEVVAPSMTEAGTC